MSFNLRNRSLLTVQDFTQREFHYLLDLARDLKRAKYARTEQEHLKGKEIVLIFEKTSTRTRCAFEVACHDQGAHVTYLDPAGSQIGHKESVKDTARVLGRMYDAIEFRGYSQEAVDDLARFAGVPVFNGLTDEYHPTQMVADVMTMREYSDKPLHEIQYAYIGDTRSNMGHSLMIVGCLLGMDVRICGPQSLWPSDSYVKIARGLEAKYGAKLTITDSPKDAVAVDGGAEGGLGGKDQAAQAISGQRRLDEGHQQSPRQVHALSPRVPQSRDEDGARYSRAIRHLRHGGHRGGVRVGNEYRVRTGRKPHAHDQSDPGRDARGLGSCASSWHSAAMLCCGVASP
jgi:ornithine carbamoyltransferase